MPTGIRRHTDSLEALQDFGGSSESLEKNENMFVTVLVS